MIPQDTINTILETARIEEVVGEFLTLRKRGVNLVGLCPFHSEKTPSFTVSPAKGLFKCFGCGRAGNSVKFLMEHEHFTYVEAIRYLAKKYHIEIEEEEETPEQKAARSEKEALFALNEFAKNYFVTQLFETEKGKSVGLSYFRERSLLEHTIRTFQLGYCPDLPDSFTTAALKAGYKKELLIRSGLTIESERDGKLFDRFRGRVIFPIHNQSGRTIGFGGRILSSDKKLAKYVNSPESEIYQKSKALYGIYFARNAIVRKDRCYLVEGYTDVISLYQAGFENVVASSGTSLTSDQIRLIKRYTPNITILYDGDEAGLKASFRGIDMILSQGMNVRLVLFPEGEDPDSFVRNHRTAEVEEFLEEASNDFIRFKTNILLKEAGGDPVKKAGVIREIIQSIAQIPDPLNRTVYVKETAGLMEIPEQTLIAELNRHLRKIHKSRINIPDSTEADQKEELIKQKPVAVNPADDSFQERDVIRLLLQFPNEVLKFTFTDDYGNKSVEKFLVYEYIVQDLRNDQIRFSEPLFQKIFDWFSEQEEKLEGQPVNPAPLTQQPDQELNEKVAEMLISRFELSPNWKSKARIDVTSEKELLKDAVTSSLLSLKSKKLLQEIDRIREELKKAEEEQDEEGMLLLQQQYVEKKKISNEINRRLSRNILF
ncbi:MAG: DNA primase [Bacteroidales bacterium]